jgi:hypothetical protein
VVICTLQLNFLALSSSALITAKRMELARKVKSDKAAKTTTETEEVAVEETNTPAKGKKGKAKAADSAST